MLNEFNSIFLLLILTVVKDCFVMIKKI